jgi:hypothetical protein
MAIFYTIESKKDGTDESGYPLANEDNQFICAKKVKDALSKSMNSYIIGYSYYVRLDSSSGLYDPRVFYSLPENNSTYIDRVCKNKEWTKVSPDAFIKYLNFLKTETDLHLKDATRACFNM